MSHRGNQREFRKYFDTSGKTIYQELRDASKVVLRNISVNDYIKKGERSQISNLIFHLENTENRRKLNLKKFFPEEFLSMHSYSDCLGIL